MKGVVCFLEFGNYWHYMYTTLVVGPFKNIVVLGSSADFGH